MEEWKECKLKDICDYGKDRIEVSSLDNSTYISTENMLPNRAGITIATISKKGNIKGCFDFDDDIYYPTKWLEKLYLSYISHPEDIHVHRAHRVNLNATYENWQKHVMEENARYDNFLTGVGGVLYPPKCFTKEVLREDIFLKNAPFADDIWFWAMCVLNNKKITKYTKLTRS